MLSGPGELLAPASGLPAIVACNVITLEFAEGIVRGAEEAGLPVLLSVSHNVIRFHSGLQPLASACRALAASAAVPIGLHLDHCEDGELVREAAELGFASAMFDASRLPYEQNVDETARVTGMGHEFGLWMEAELGEIGGKDGAHAFGARTDPGEAAAFAAATGVDGLAVAVGTSHAMREATARPDLDLIRLIAAAVPIPLVLHGSSGVPDDGIRDAVAAGIRKVNVGTQLSAAYGSAVAAGLDGSADPRPAIASGRDAIAATVNRLLSAVSAPVAV